MSFAIMRFAKLKTGSPISGSVSHIARSRPTPNADPARRHLNRSIVGPAHGDAAAMRSAIADRTPEKFRKDAVRILEFVVTATPDWFDQNPGQVDEYFDSAVDWLKQKFGSDNVVCAVQHNDESTPHAHVMVVPVDPDSGKLNAKRWVGGRGKLRQLQTDFANHQAGFGVERGKPNPDRQHKTLAAWRAGHSQLDSRESALQERESTLAEGYERTRLIAATAKIAACKIESAQADLDKREASILERERAVIRSERELSTRSSDIEVQRLQIAKARSENQALAEKLSNDQKNAALATQEADKAKKTAEAMLARAKELEARIEPREADLSAREKENDNFAETLKTAVQELEEWESEKKTWEKERDSWLAKHRPISLSAVQELSLDLAALPDKQRMDQMRTLFKNDKPMAEAVDRLNWVTYEDGSVTPEGRKALVEHGSLQEHARREREWKRFNLDSGPKGP